MVNDFMELLTLCDQELRHREYRSDYYRTIKSNWNNLKIWMDKNNLKEFNEEIGKMYCDEKFGTHLMPHNPTLSLKVSLRSIRMLISYQKDGTFEFRTPSVEYIFDGIIGDYMLGYLDFCKNELFLAYKTIENKRLYLYSFSKYLNNKSLIIDNLTIDVIEDFFKSMNYSLASRHNAARVIKLFLLYVYENNLSNKNYSTCVLSDNYKKNCKLPTIYEEEEIRKIINSIERSSAIGKRDYLILLLSTEYGWRASDITNLRFTDIDWDNNIIKFTQHKTKVPIEFPLLASVGNAIIDYLQYSRPLSNAPEIIVSLENANKGKPLSSPSIHSIVTKYIRLANIDNWQNKKHGPHSMRHSLATNLLKKNITMPVISSVMGHQNTETTGIYLTVDYNNLKKCVLPMPALHSPFYN